MKIFFAPNIELPVIRMMRHAAKLAASIVIIFCAFYTTQAQTVADLSVTQSDAQDPIAVGGNLTYTITALNNGPVAATNVTLTAIEHQSLTFVSANPTQGSCTRDSVSGNVTCALGGLANGAMATVTITLTPTTAGRVSTTVSVLASEIDSNGANNSAVEDTSVTSSTQAQTVVSVPRLNPPGITNNAGFNFEEAVVQSTGLVYSGTTGAYGNEVAVINPTTRTVVAVAPLASSSATLSFARVNQTTGLVYFRNTNLSEIVVIDGRPGSATFNRALPSITFADGQVQAFSIDETNARLYATVASTPARVKVVDINPASGTFHQILSSVDLPANASLSGLLCVAANDQTNKIYLAAQGSSGGVYVLNGTTLSLTRISTVAVSRVAVNKSANLIYANAGSTVLTVLDGTTDSVLTTITLQANILGGRKPIAINTQTSRVYVPLVGSATTGSIQVIDGNRASPSFNTIIATIAGLGDVQTLDVDESINRVIAVGNLSKRSHIIDGATNTLFATITSPQLPGGVALNLTTHRAYISNQQNIVQEVDLSTGAGNNIVTGATVESVVVNPNNHLYYAGLVSADTKVSFFDQAGQTGIVTNAPHSNGRYTFLARNTPTNRIYALNTSANLTGDTFSLPGFVSVIDGNTNAVVANVAAGNQPFGLGVNQTTNKIYITNAGFGVAFPGGISVIDGATNQSTSANISAFPANTTFTGPVVVNEAANKIYFRAGGGFGVLDGATNTASPLTLSFTPFEFKISQTLNRVYAAGSDNSVHVLNGSTNAEIASLPFGTAITNMAVNETTGRVYVVGYTNATDASIAVIDGNSNTIVAQTSLSDNRPDTVAVNQQNNHAYVLNSGKGTLSILNGATLASVAQLALPLTAGSLDVDETTSRVYIASRFNADQSGVIIVSDIDMADLSVGLTDSPDPVIIGNNLTYTVSVQNNGPSAATGIALTDPLPAGAAFVSASTTQGSCSQASGTVTCAIGNLANSGTATVTIVVSSNTPGTINNTVSVTGTEIDPNAANNTASASTTVATASNLQISGRVLDSGNGVGGVAVTLSGTSSQVVQTDASGSYSFTIAAGGTYTVVANSPYFVFTPLRADFAAVATSQTANFTVVAQATPTPTPPLTDDFTGPQRDPTKWNLGTLTQPSGGFDPQVTVAQLNGQLRITPRAGVTGAHYNGYVSTNSYDFTNGQTGVEVVQIATGGANTIFALGQDSANYYRFITGTGSSLGLTKLTRAFGLLDDAPVLVFQVKIGGVITQQAIPYDPVAHRFWRFRHDAPVNAILFETSTDNNAFTERYRKSLEKSVSALAVELSAGTAAPSANGNPAVFDNLALVTSTAQFSAANYTAAENAGQVNIAITRSGNVSSSPATLVYTTVDNQAAVRCDDRTTLPGVAFARCDYATSVDELRFAAGETTKTLTVPIIDDGFAEGDETFTLLLRDATGASVGAPGRIMVTIKDNDAAGAPNPVFTTPFFVRQHYLDFLAREPEAGEPWSNILNRCADVNNVDPNNPAAGCDRITVSGAFFGSPEFLSKGVYLIAFYRVAFNRLPEYTEFAPDLRSVTGATGAETNAKRAAFANNFVLRTEFSSPYGALSNANYVAALLGRYGLTQVTTPDPAQPDGPQKVTLTQTELLNRLTAGTLTRAQVLRAIVQSDEVSLNREALNAFVAAQYYGFLRRTPDTGGFNGWVNYLNTHPGDFRTMVNGFMNSIEYRLRFGISN